MSTDIVDVDICVVGAGISGLALGAFAAEHSSVCILEAKDTVGGILEHTQTPTALFDHAANGWLDNEPSVHALIHLLNADNLVLPANTNKGTRYLVHNGQLHPLSPKLLFQSTPLISWAGKFRALFELFKGRIKTIEPSMTDVMTHRFGTAIVDNFVAPMCAGIYASPPEDISVPAAFPRFWQQLNQGSLIAQLMKRLWRKDSAPPPRLTSLRSGTGQLCTVIAKHLQDKEQLLLCGTPATEIKYQDGWIVSTPTKTIHAKHLALTCPAPTQAALLQSFDPEMATQLTNIEYAPVVVIMLQFPTSAFVDPPVGFGALLTRKEQQSGLLGILFTSHLYPDRFATDTVATRSILGGAIAPNVMKMTDEALIQLTLDKHRTLFNSPNATPSFVKVLRWSQGIPKYKVGHHAFQHSVASFHHQHPQLRLSGNHIFGVSIKDCIRIGQEHATDFQPPPSP